MSNRYLLRIKNTNVGEETLKPYIGAWASHLIYSTAMMQGCNRFGVRSAEGQRHFRSNQGFTLLELILVLGIIGIVVTIALPRFGVAGSRYQADLAARQLVQELALAQAMARAQSSAQTVTINPGTDQVRLVNATALDPHMSTHVTSFSDRPYRADITLSEFNGDNDVVFDGWGLPDSNGMAILSVGPETRTIVLNGETGKATVE